MKKMLAILLTFSLLITAVAAFAEDTDSTQDQTPGVNEPGQFPGGERPDDMPEPPEGGRPDDAPEPPNGEKPDAAPEKPNGEKPEDAPAEPDDGQADDGQPDGEMPEGTTEKQDSKKPNGKKPSGGKPSAQKPGDQAPEMLDWDKLAAEGVISEETAAKVKAYMEENKPEDMADKQSSEKPADPPKKPDGEEPANPNLEIVNQLLEAGVLTQEEADAVSAWITENMTMNPLTDKK